jgi:hypothetical protein
MVREILLSTVQTAAMIAIATPAAITGRAGAETVLGASSGFFRICFRNRSVIVEVSAPRARPLGRPRLSDHRGRCRRTLWSPPIRGGSLAPRYRRSARAEIQCECPLSTHSRPRRCINRRFRAFSLRQPDQRAEKYFCPSVRAGGWRAHRDRMAKDTQRPKELIACASPAPLRDRPFWPVSCAACANEQWRCRRRQDAAARQRFVAG